MLQVFGHRQLEVQAPGLKDDAGLLPRPVRFPGHIEPLDPGHPAARHHQGGKNAEERGLAAAVGTQQAENLRRLHGKAQVIERQAIAIVMRQPVQFNRHRFGSYRRTGCSLPDVRSGSPCAYLLPVAFSIITVSSSGRWITLARSSSRAYFRDSAVVSARVMRAKRMV